MALDLLSLLGPEHPEQAINEKIARTLIETKWDPEAFIDRMYPWGVEGSPLQEYEQRTWQREVNRFIANAIREGERKIWITIASGHGIGKSAEIAMLVHWAMLCHHCRGTITANTKAQLETKTMPEMAKWTNLLFAKHWLDQRITSVRRRDGDEDWRMDALPWTKENPDAFGGLHNALGIVLVVFDEASNIHKVIYESIDGAMSDKDNLIIWIRFGNPLRNNGRFAEAFRKEPPKVGASLFRQIDSRDVEGTDHEFINELIRLNGGEDSDYAKSRWRGIFPDQSDWQLIDSKSVDRAMRENAPRAAITDPVIAGIDFARGGGDNTTLRFRKGYDAKTFPSYSWPKAVGKNSMVMAAILSEKLNAHGYDYVMADGGGIGGPIIDRLRQLGHAVLEVLPGGAADRSEKYANKRAEIWVRFRDWLDEGGAIPDDPELRQQIVQQEYGFSGDKDKIILHSKEAMREDGLKSPDDAEALIQTFGFEVAAKPEGSIGKPHRAGRTGADRSRHPFESL